MKLISLNAWGGKTFEPLMEYLAKEAPSTDIFCLQEITRADTKIQTSRGYRTHLFDEIAELLPGFQKFFSTEAEGADAEDVVDFPSEVGQATFVRNSFRIHHPGSFFIYGTKRNKINKGIFGANLFYIHFEYQGKKFLISNLHGISEPGHKLDTPERLEQSRRIKDFLDKEAGAKILCGDFNLLPDTQSIAMLEKDMRNLISEFRIPRTRSRLSPFFGKPDFQKFADYVFVSPDIEVVRFEVPDVQISDHLPMVLEFR